MDSRGQWEFLPFFKITDSPLAQPLRQTGKLPCVQGNCEKAKCNSITSYNPKKYAGTLELLTTSWLSF